MWYCCKANHSTDHNLCGLKKKKKKKKRANCAELSNSDMETNQFVPKLTNYLEYTSSHVLLGLEWWIRALHQTSAYSDSDASTAKLTPFPLSPILVLISGTISPQHVRNSTTSMPIQHHLAELIRTFWFLSPFFYDIHYLDVHVRI